MLAQWSDLTEQLGLPQLQHCGALFPLARKICIHSTDPRYPGALFSPANAVSLGAANFAGYLAVLFLLG